MKSITCLLLLLLMCSTQSFAMSNRHRNFIQPCDDVWTAAVVVVKSQDYRIVSISKEEQIVSVITGTAWSGERVITLSLAPGTERGCTATVQSRFSGWGHSDGPDLLIRLMVEVAGQTVDRNSKAFQRYKHCIEDSYTSASKCESRFKKDLLAASQAQKAPAQTSRDWWQPTAKPSPK